MNPQDPNKPKDSEYKIDLSKLKAKLAAQKQAQITRPKIVRPAATRPSVAQTLRLKNTTAHLVKSARSLLKSIKMNSWDEFAKYSALPVLPPYDNQPFTVDTASALLGFLEINGTAILEAVRKQEITQESEIVAPTYHKLTHELKFANGATLFPQQQKSFEAILELFLEWRKDPENAEWSGAILTLPPGKGKSYITAGLVKYLADNNLLTLDDTAALHQMYNAWCLTPAGQVLTKTKEKFKELGVPGLDQRVMVTSHQSLSTISYKHMFRTETEDYFDNEREVYSYAYFPPVFCNVDEAHQYKKPASERTKRAMAWVRAGRTFWLFTTATPAVTLADTEFMTCAIRPKYLGTQLTQPKFRMFINEVNGYSRIPIDVANDAAGDRYRKRMARVFITPPADPQKVRAFNKVMLVDFANEEDRRFYMDAEARWLEAKERAGERPSERGAEMAMFTVMHQAGEACCVPIWGELIYKAWQEGLAPVCGVKFQETLRDICIYLVVKKGVPREKIALIWGGAEILKDEDRLTEEQLADLMIKRHEQGNESLTKRERSLIKKNMVALKGRLRRNIDEKESIARDHWLKTLGLNKQTVNERWLDNQAFQKGSKEICLFTASAGGIGIDLDHQYQTARPRVLFSTITYYGEEMLQIFGRCLRIATLTNVHQYMVFLKGTLAALHVAPKLDRKLASINRYATGREDYVSELSKAHIAMKPDENLARFRTDADIEKEEPEMYGDTGNEEEEEE